MKVSLAVTMVTLGMAVVDNGDRSKLIKIWRYKLWMFRNSGYVTMGGLVIYDKKAKFNDFRISNSLSTKKK